MTNLSKNYPRFIPHGEAWDIEEYPCGWTTCSPNETITIHNTSSKPMAIYGYPGYYSTFGDIVPWFRENASIVYGARSAYVPTEGEKQCGYCGRWFIKDAHECKGCGASKYA